jgi:hypothetical protein
MLHWLTVTGLYCIDSLQQPLPFLHEIHFIELVVTAEKTHQPHAQAVHQQQAVFLIPSQNQLGQAASASSTCQCDGCCRRCWRTRSANSASRISAVAT